MRQWQYMTLVGPWQSEETLSAYGTCEWELVFFVMDSVGFRYIFKRPIPEPLIEEE